MNGIILLEDDTLIKAIAVEHGKAERLEPQPGIAGAFRHHCIWRDGTFYYAITRYYNYPDPDDNGYCAILIPRASNPDDTACKIIDAFCHSGASGEALYSFGTKDQPEAN